MTLNCTSNYYYGHILHVSTYSTHFQWYWSYLILFVTTICFLWLYIKKFSRSHNNKYDTSKKNTSSSNLKYTIEQHHDISSILEMTKNNNDPNFETYILWLSGAIGCISTENLIILSVRNHNGDLIATSCAEIWHVDLSEYFASNTTQIFLKWLKWFYISPLFWRVQACILWIPPFEQFSGTYYHTHISESESTEIAAIIENYIFQIRPNVSMILDVKEPGDQSKKIIINNDRQSIVSWFRMTKAIFPANTNSLDTYINTICKHRRKRNLRAYRKQFTEGGGKIRYLFPLSQQDFDEIQVRMKELTSLKLESARRNQGDIELYKSRFYDEWMSSMVLKNKLLNNNQVIFVFAQQNNNEHLLGFMVMFIHSATNQILLKSIGIHDNDQTRQLRVYQNLLLSGIDWSLRNGYHVIDFGSCKEDRKALLLEKEIRLCDDEQTRGMMKCTLASSNWLYKFAINQVKNSITQATCETDDENLEHM